MIWSVDGQWERDTKQAENKKALEYQGLKCAIFGGDGGIRTLDAGISRMLP